MKDMEQSPHQTETLLDRLKRMKAEANSINLGVVENEHQLPTRDFNHLASIAIKMARANLADSSQPDRIDRLRLVNSYHIVPDEQIPDAHKNETCLTGFVRSYLPKSDWPMFIDSQE